MANVDNGLVTPEQTGTQPAAPGRTRAGKPAGPAFKPMHHEEMDPQEFADMLGIYDDSFRNMAEGEVVKGTVLKASAHLHARPWIGGATCAPGRCLRGCPWPLYPRGAGPRNPPIARRAALSISRVGNKKPASL